MAQKAQAQAGAHSASLLRTLLHAPADTQLILSESTGVISISVASQTLGQIKYASQAACRLLGYTRAQLERRNVNVIIPSPIAEAQCVLTAIVVLHSLPTLHALFFVQQHTDRALPPYGSQRYH